MTRRSHCHERCIVVFRHTWARARANAGKVRVRRGRTQVRRGDDDEDGALVQDVFSTSQGKSIGLYFNVELGWVMSPHAYISYLSKTTSRRVVLNTTALTLNRVVTGRK